MKLNIFRPIHDLQPTSHGWAVELEGFTDTEGQIRAVLAPLANDRAEVVKVSLGTIEELNPTAKDPAVKAAKDPAETKIVLQGKASTILSHVNFLIVHYKLLPKDVRGFELLAAAVNPQTPPTPPSVF